MKEEIDEHSGLRAESLPAFVAEEAALAEWALNASAYAGRPLGRVYEHLPYNPLVQAAAVSASRGLRTGLNGPFFGKASDKLGATPLVVWPALRDSSPDEMTKFV